MHLRETNVCITWCVKIQCIQLYENTKTLNKLQRSLVFFKTGSSYFCTAYFDTITMNRKNSNESLLWWSLSVYLPGWRAWGSLGAGIWERSACGQSGLWYGSIDWGPAWSGEEDNALEGATWRQSPPGQPDVALSRSGNVRRGSLHELWPTTAQL